MKAPRAVPVIVDSVDAPAALQANPGAHDVPPALEVATQRAVIVTSPIPPTWSRSSNSKPSGHASSNESQHPDMGTPA